VRVRDGLMLAVDRSMQRSIQFALLVLITACGGSSSQPDAGDIDAPPDAPQGPGTAITVETDAAPSLIAYRDGAGAWKPAKTIDVDTFELDVHGPYIVTVACDDGVGNITTWQTASTPDDDRELFMSCASFFDASVALTGTMLQAGSVTASFFTDSSSAANWAFDLPIEAGVPDVIAFDANRILGRRDLTVTGDTAITPALDLTQGSTLVAAPLVATNAAATETVNASINITTKNATFVRLFRGAPAQTKVVPPGFLNLGERQSALVAASTGLGSRSIRRTFRAGDPTDFTLPASLGAVSYAQPGANLQITWSTLPEHDIVDIYVDAFSEDFTTYTFHYLEISAAYIVATGATTMTLDTEIPGYKPEWRVDYTKEYYRSVSAYDFRDGETATSSTSEGVNVPPALVRSGSRRSPAIERAPGAARGRTRTLGPSPSSRAPANVLRKLVRAG
jgi:hypothetical protein